MLLLKLRQQVNHLFQCSTEVSFVYQKGQQRSWRNMNSMKVLLLLLQWESITSIDTNLPYHTDNYKILNKVKKEI